MVGVDGRSRRLNYTATAGFAIFASLVLAASPPASQETSSLQPAQTSSAAGYGHMSAVFVVNRGQAPSEVRLLAAGVSRPILFADREVRLVEARYSRETELALVFEDALATVRAHGERPTPTIVNYLTGADPKRWKTDLPTYGSVRYTNIWTGIDGIFRATAGALEYEFVVAPGADPAAIQLRYRGARTTRLTGTGDLEVSSGAGTISDTAPRTFQIIGGRTTPVESRYVLHPDGHYGFAVGPYDKDQPLVIDPTIGYSTLLGGSGTDGATGIAVDGGGSAYVSGSTLSPGLATAEAYDRSGGTGTTGLDAFIARINPEGTAFTYITYLGGSANDEAYGIAVDVAGNAYVTGYTESQDFPATPGAFRNAMGPGGHDAFVVKLNDTGSALVYSTLLGTNAPTDARAVAVDSAGAAHVAGDTASTNLPTTAGAIQGPRTATGQRDAFLIKLAPSGSDVMYGTYIGGSQRDSGNALALDLSGHAYVTGRTSSTDLRTSPDAVQATSSTTTFKSTDAGVTFFGVGGEPRFRRVTALAVDPHAPETIYAGSLDAGMYVSEDGGSSWTSINSGLPAPFPAIEDIALHPSAPATIVAATSAGIYKSSDFGATWRGVSPVPATRIAFARPDPAVLYGTSAAGGLKSVDGGESWTTVLALPTTAVAVHPSDSRLAYFGTRGSGVIKTEDGGASWTPMNNGLHPIYWDITGLGLDPLSPNVLYAGVANSSALFATVDGGASWVFSGGAVVFAPSRFTFDEGRVYVTGPQSAVAEGGSWRRLLVRGTSSSVDAVAASGEMLIIASPAGDDAFGYKISTANAGDGLVYGTYLGGSGADGGSAIDVDGDGNAFVLLQTSSADFPWTVALDRRVDAALVKLNAAGSRYEYSAPVGTANYTSVNGLAIDPNGVAYVVGASDDTSRYIWIERIDTDGLISARTTIPNSGFLSGHWPAGLAIDAAAAVYLTGRTNQSSFPVSADAPQRDIGGSWDAFLTKVSFADVGPVNLATGRTAVASSVAGPEYTAGNAIDGDPSTRWSSQYSDPQWIYIDLGDRYHIDRVVLHWQIAFARFYELHVSDDAVTWLPVRLRPGSGTTSESDGGTDNLPNLNAIGRYLRVYGTARATPWGYSLWEVQVYGIRAAPDIPPGGSTNLALNRNAWASSMESEQYQAIRAVDGLPSTRWSSEFSDPQWIVVDLERPIDITRVVLRWETAYGADYRIEVSNDNSTWTTIRTVTGGDGEIDDVTELSGTGRYLRIYGTRRGTEWGYSLWELEVYGAISAAPVDVVLYASDVSDRDLHGWVKATDAASPDGVELLSPDAGWASRDAPPPWLDNPEVKWVDFHFIAPEAGTYKVWVRLKATGDSDENDSVWVQFSSATIDGMPAYRWGTQDALLVALEECDTCPLSGWGWSDGTWWLDQPSIVALPAGSQTFRVQVREDGVQVDQIVLSPVRYRDARPGARRDDSTIVPK